MAAAKKKAAEAPAVDAAAVLAGQVIDGVALEASAPGVGELVVDPRREADVFRAMDAHDEVQILDELSGRPSDVMVYSFESGGHLQTGLSYAGVAECVRTMNAAGWTSIRAAKDIAPQWEEVTEENEWGDTVTYIQVTVYAEDVKNGGGHYGVSRQAKFQVYREQEGKPKKKPKLDGFAANKALSKAQRNAMLLMIPAAYREAVIAKAINDQSRVKEIRVSMGDATAEMPPPLMDEQARALKAECRAIYDEIKLAAGGPQSLPPGQFNIKLRRAEIEHRALEELRDELASRLEHLRGAEQAA